MDFEGKGNKEQDQGIDFTYKRTTDQHDPVEKIEWKKAWYPVLADRVKNLGRDLDHSVPTPTTKNISRAEIVALYEAAYSELVQLLREVSKELSEQRERNKHIHNDRVYLQERWDEETDARDRWRARFETLIDLTVEADRVNHVDLARAREGEL